MEEPQIFEERHEQGVAHYEKMGWGGSYWWDVGVRNTFTDTWHDVDGFTTLERAREWAVEMLGQRVRR